MADLLKPYLTDPLCRGAGEIGLETANDREMAILKAQLDLGFFMIKIDKQYDIHSPRKNKEEITTKTLKLLRDLDHLKEHIVIDHCSAATIGRVLDRGFHAGVTLSSGKTGLKELIEILATCPAHLNRIMVNTDSGSVFHENLAECIASETIPSQIMERISRSNALRFFDL